MRTSNSNCKPIAAAAAVSGTILTNINTIPNSSGAPGSDTRDNYRRLGKEKGKHFLKTTLKNIAKAQWLRSRHLLPPLTSALVTLMRQCAIVMSTVLKKSRSSAFGRLSEEGLHDKISVIEVLGLQPLLDRLPRVTEEIILLMKPVLRKKNLDRLREVLAYYTSQEFIILLIIRNQVDGKANKAFLGLAASLLDHSCARPKCHRIRIPPFQSPTSQQPHEPDLDETGDGNTRTNFHGSAFCVIHHQQVINSPILWFLLPEGTSRLPSFRKYCTENELENVFLCYQDCVAYSSVMDRAGRVLKAHTILRTYLQANANRALFSGECTQEERDILEPIITGIANQDYHAILFKNLMTSMQTRMEMALFAFKETATYQTAGLELPLDMQQKSAFDSPPQYEKITISDEVEMIPENLSFKLLPPESDRLPQRTSIAVRHSTPLVEEKTDTADTQLESNTSGDTKPLPVPERNSGELDYSSILFSPMPSGHLRRLSNPHINASDSPMTGTTPESSDQRGLLPVLDEYVSPRISQRISTTDLTTET